MEEIGGIEVAADWFKLAREVNPKGKLFLSETSILTNRGETETEQAAFERHHKILVDAGAPIDGICLQGHFSTGMTARLPHVRLPEPPLVDSQNFGVTETHRIKIAQVIGLRVLFAVV